MSSFYHGRWSGPVMAGVLALAAVAEVRAQDFLPGTKALAPVPDRPALMVAGIGRYLDRLTDDSASGRAQFWHSDFSDRSAYDASVQPNRDRLARMLGMVDPRILHPAMEYMATEKVAAKVAENDRFTVYAVRWPVFEGVYGEGLLLEPKGRVFFQAVALPDADELPEAIVGLVPGLPAGLQFARRLAENGCRVVVPTLVDRGDELSGNALIGCFTNEPHREWIYRQAYVLGRHVIGYEVQKVLSAVDWLSQPGVGQGTSVGVVGWGEGGLLALYSAALDPRISAAAVSGYFGRRDGLWREPIYRNVFGLLREFGDAEIASLIAPRSLVVEYSRTPQVDGPPAPSGGQVTVAAPGQITTPVFSDVAAEVERARGLSGPFASSIQFSNGAERAPTGPMGDDSLHAFVQALNGNSTALKAPGSTPIEIRGAFDPASRQRRQVREMEAFTQHLIPISRLARDDFLWKKVPVTTPAAWDEAMRPYRPRLWDDVIGKLPASDLPLAPRSRKIYDEPSWTGYEVTVDVFPDVFASGYLLMPKGLRPGEKRPVVVTQHGLDGVPEDVVDWNPKHPGFVYYQAFAKRLVEQGFIVFAPQNPYWGGQKFRVLQRKANPLHLSLFSFILAQHERVLDFLSGLPEVDPQRIGFYGLSYGGKTAVRIPALLDRYCLSICSGDFNEWLYKVAAIDWRKSYMYAIDYEIPEFNLGRTFNYAEMTALIAPRPFMVERGHRDSVGDDEWVAFEYAKVRRLYDELGVPERTQIEYFNGHHMIHGVGTFEFLRRFLNWPKSGAPAEAKAQDLGPPKT